MQQPRPPASPRGRRRASVHSDCEPSREEVLSHGAAHDADADPPDTRDPRAHRPRETKGRCIHLPLLLHDPLQRCSQLKLPIIQSFLAFLKRRMRSGRGRKIRVLGIAIPFPCFFERPNPISFLQGDNDNNLSINKQELIGSQSPRTQFLASQHPTTGMPGFCLYQNSQVFMNSRWGSPPIPFKKNI